MDGLGWHLALGLLALPLMGPLASFLLILIFGPCVLNLLTKFIASRLQAFEHQLLLHNQIMLLQDIQLIPTRNPETTITALLTRAPTPSLSLELSVLYTKANLPLSFYLCLLLKSAHVFSVTTFVNKKGITQGDGQS